MKSWSVDDPMDPARAAALHAALGIGGALPEPGTALPPFFHQAYFWQVFPPGDLGRDGHPRAGRLLPDLGLARRMWAGGGLEFLAPLVAGRPARRTTTVEKVTQKTGRTGPLAFLTLRHDIMQGEKTVLRERQDLVFRQDPQPGAPAQTPPEAPQEADHRQEARFDTTLLFHYSALTMNGHRIHYDLDYAQGTEGYDGLVVHGPLLAQRLMLLAETQLGTLKSFEFRATSALCHHETAQLCAKGSQFWVTGGDGRLCMTAQAEVRERP